MVSILPGGSNWDVIGKSLGENVSRALPQAVQQGYQRGMGYNAIDRLQQELAGANGDFSKILPAIARSYIDNPNLERSGIGPFALQNAKVQNAYGQPQGQGTFPQQPNIPNQEAPPTSMGEKSDFVTPSPFNIMTPQDMDAEARRFAAAVNDPNGYNTRLAQLQNQNQNATAQRESLEDAALKANVPPSELPRFIVVNSHLDPRNPSKWAQDAKRNYAQVKSNDDKLEKAFIPGIGSGLLGRNREKTLKDLEPTVQDQVKKGLEQETRKFLADQYLSPTEIESLIHPLNKKNEKAIEQLPKGMFPADTGEQLSYFAPSKDFKSFEEMREKKPEVLKKQQEELANFFRQNVDKDTSLLVLRDKLWKDKDYDWQQIGPAIRQAEQMGLKLEPFQSTEMTDIETQPPMQSLPDIFRDWDRFKGFLRGNK